jgi:type IV fimbrial biogenesis protein FimT
LTKKVVRYGYIGAVNALLVGPARRTGSPHGCPAPTHAAVDGFTLIEALLVMAITSTVVALAAPSYRALADSIRLTSASNAFVAHLYLARSEAIKRNARVVLCKSVDGIACATTGGWEQGRLVFHDANNNGLLDAGEQVLAIEPGLHTDLRLVGNQSVSKYVSFDSTGSTRLVGGGFQAGTLTLCRQSLSPGEARLIVLNAVGRPRVRKAAVAEC